MNYEKELEDYLKEHEVKCPYCGCKEVGIDNWDMFKGKQDWFYYCKSCDDTFGLDYIKKHSKE